MKPINTQYAGCRFRSRLEARWAVFFDAAGLDWQYEQQGYTLDNGTKYLPDFRLPTLDTYVEVKGDPAALNVASAYGFANQVGPLLLLGDVPYVPPGSTHGHYQISMYGGVTAELESIVFDPEYLHSEERFFTSVGEPIPKVDSPRFAQSVLAGVVLPGWDARNANYYTAARSARFEHGETPSVGRGGR